MRFIKIYQSTFSVDELREIEVRGYLTLSEKLALFKAYDKHLNIENKEVIAIIRETSAIPNGLEIKRVTRSIYTHLVPTYHNLTNQSPITFLFWVARGYNETEAKTFVSNEQKRRSPYNNIERLAKEKGCSEDEIRSLLRDKAVKGAQKSARHWKREYWLSQGYSEEETTKILKEKAEKSSSFTLQFWINRGYTEEEAREKQYKIASNGSLESMMERYPDDYENRYKKRIEKIAHYGKDNKQFGKPAPKKSGSGVSGYYKGIYFRSLFEYFFIKKCEKEGIPFVPNDVSIEKNTNKVVIPYLYEGRKRHYIPDFIINGTTIVEVKNHLAFQNPEWKLKEEGLKEFLKRSNVYTDYKLVDERELDFNVDVLKQDIVLGVIKVDENKQPRLEKSIKKYEHQIYKKRLQVTVGKGL